MGEKVKVGRSCAAPNGQARTKKICVAVNEEELASLDASAAEAGLSRTEYILQSTVYADSSTGLGVIDASALCESMSELAHQVRKYGSNFNQIAFALNLAKQRARTMDQEKEIAKACESIERLGREVAEVNWRIMEAMGAFPVAVRLGKRR